MKWANSSTDLLVLPRKAAFFASIAADAVIGGSAKHSGDLWLLATQLYARDAGCSYGWGALRAACLSALSTKGTNLLSLEAAEQLLSLLGQLDPDEEEQSGSRLEDDDAVGPATDDLDTSDHSTGRGNQDVKEGLKSTANTYAKQLQQSFNLLKANSAFLAQQSKWAYDDPIPPLITPLGEESPLASSVTTLSSVWNRSNMSRCSRAQNDCISRIRSLRRSLATSSLQLGDFPAIYGDGSESLAPLYVVSANANDPEARLEVDNAKKPDKKDDEGSMATFFNPFENKRNAGGAGVVTSVAEEEERAISIEFGNRLGVPLEVTRCQLEFSGSDTSRVMATSLSFVLPPKAKAFAIQFPFTVLARSKVGVDVEQGENFEVDRMNLTCLGRSFSLPIKPDPASVLGGGYGCFPASLAEYPELQKVKKEYDPSMEASFPIQAYPSQPKLRILFADSHTPVEKLSFELSDGELFTSQPFLLECYAGPSGRGCVEQLEVHVGGIPGLNRKLFDSSAPTERQPDDDFLDGIFEKELSSPLKARALAGKLSLDAINGKGDETDTLGSLLRIQIASTHTMTRKLKKDVELTLRFRYRGACNETAQVWRNHEICVRIKRRNGPRITSIAFHPDILTDSYFSELGETQKLKASSSAEEELQAREPYDTKDGTGTSKLNFRVGQYSSVNVCSGEIGLLVTVSNDTENKIQLSTESGHVRSVAHRKIDHVLLRPSMSVKIPMVLKRFNPFGKESTVDDLVRELISSTLLVWKSLNGKNGEEASGQVRVPPACLKELISKHPSFISKVCDPPCSVELSVDRSISSTSPIAVFSGSPGCEISVRIAIADWVSVDERKKGNVRMELCCIRETKNAHQPSPSTNDFVWAGKLRDQANMAETALQHRARIIFCRPGNYIVSACAIITRELSEKGAEEIWWAPVAQRIAVKGDIPAQ